MREALRVWCRLACGRAVVLRGLRYAVVVGAVLIAINHGDALLRGDLDPRRLMRMALTILVPYCVSVLSSVGAMRQLARVGASPPRPPPAASPPPLPPATP